MGLRRVNVVTEQTNAAAVPPQAPGRIVLLTGLSGAGKTSIGRAVTLHLQAQGVRADLLDGDELRSTLCSDLGFSKGDRMTNLQRIFFVAERLAKHGVQVVVAAIAPFREQRDALRARLPHLLEVFVEAPLAVCEARDPKGIYCAFRAGQVQQLTGIDSPYEPPLRPHLSCHTAFESLDESVAKVLALLASQAGM